MGSVLRRAPSGDTRRDFQRLHRPPKFSLDSRLASKIPARQNSNRKEIDLESSGGYRSTRASGAPIRTWRCSGASSSSWSTASAAPAPRRRGGADEGRVDFSHTRSLEKHGVLLARNTTASSSSERTPPKRAVLRCCSKDFADARKELGRGCVTQAPRLPSLRLGPLPPPAQRPELRAEVPAHQRLSRPAPSPGLASRCTYEHTGSLSL